VALIGQGPDELFGGYTRHLGVHYGAAWRALPGWLRTPSAALARALPRNDTVKRGLYSLHEPTGFVVSSRYSPWFRTTRCRGFSAPG
jgi:asparagine synthase (glutamine-hydrolysing)